MKHILIFLILSISCLAETYSFGYSLNTTHIKSPSRDYDFVEDNQVFTLEKRNGSEIKGFTHFTNSFGNESFGFYFGKIFDKNRKGFYFVLTNGIIKGYNKEDILKSKSCENLYYIFENKTVFYKDYSYFFSPIIGYSFKEIDLRIALISNALITGISIKL